MPATATRPPGWFKYSSKCPNSDVVVVFPLLPVIPMTRPFKNGDTKSSSPIRGTPPSRILAIMGASGGKPELVTAMSQLKILSEFPVSCWAPIPSKSETVS